MSKTKYSVAGEDMTATAIASAMVKKKAFKYSRAHKFYYFETDAVFAGKPVKLFFYRFGRKGEWKALLSTDTALTPYKAYQVYSMRWSIEVLSRVQVPAETWQMPMSRLRFADSVNIPQCPAVQFIIMRQKVRVVRDNRRPVP